MNLDEALAIAQDQWVDMEEAVDAARVLAAAVERVRELHRQVIDSSWPAPGHCEECEREYEANEMDYVPWPCPTVRALDGPS